MAMRINLEGKDITSAVAVSGAVIIDSAGGRLDSGEITFSDVDGLWSKWQPVIGMVLRLSQDGFDTGDLFLDQIGQERGLYVLRGLSGPAAVRQSRSRSWERVTLYQLLADVAANYGFSIFTAGISNPTYDWVDQAGETDFAFLQRICTMEGYILKVSNHRLVVYREAAMEAQSPARTILTTDWCGTPVYRQNPSPYAACMVGYGGISATVSIPGRTGQLLSRGDIRVTSIGEAQRFAAGLLRQAIREEHTISGTVLLDLSLAGGSMVRVTGMGTGDGDYMIDQVEHDLGEGLSFLRLRRKVEGGI